ncbi:MAG TPA: plastocyanin/azurin family copper-binding protein, partial [Nitrososphaera sp.]|nr:plastocyanin/azurin family copper-binding protein [Nitrososphaera sp.]
AIVSVISLQQPLPRAFAEDVIFVVPGSSDPKSVLSFDPPVQKIEKGQQIVFVNADGLDHQLVVKSADDREVFDTGVLSKNDFVSHTFSDNGEYVLECKLYPHMKGQITVTDDIATFTRTIEDQNMDVLLTQSPANPGVDEEIYYKITFIDRQTGRNHPHVDFTLTFNDSSSNFIDGAGGHTVDGQEIAEFHFDKKDAFTPAITVTGVSLVPIAPETVKFDAVVTPEFPPLLAATIPTTAAAALVSVALFMTRANRRHAT